MLRWKNYFTWCILISVVYLSGLCVAENSHCPHEAGYDAYMCGCGKSRNAASNDLDLNRLMHTCVAVVSPVMLLVMIWLWIDSAECHVSHWCCHLVIVASLLSYRTIGNLMSLTVSDLFGAPASHKTLPDRLPTRTVAVTSSLSFTLYSLVHHSVSHM